MPKAIKIAVRDLEEWTAKDFCMYLKGQLQEHGVAYKLKLPTDTIILGSVLKIFGHHNKTKAALKQFLDEIITNYDIGSIQNFGFVRALTLNIFPHDKTWEAQKKKKAVQSKPNHASPELSPAVKAWLLQLKTT